MRTVILLAALALLPCAPALARECGAGSVMGGLSAAGDALQNYDCAMLGRIYCRLSEDRDGGMEQSEATFQTAEWLRGLGRTGSHLKGHWEPLVSLAAAEVYRTKERQPGTMYYRAAYACGVSKRIGTDAAAQQRAGKAFDAAADACEKRHPMTGRSFPNPGLRDCLATAVDRVTGTTTRP